MISLTGALVDRFYNLLEAAQCRSIFTSARVSGIGRFDNNAKFRHNVGAIPAQAISLVQSVEKALSLVAHALASALLNLRCLIKALLQTTPDYIT